MVRALEHLARRSCRRVAVIKARVHGDPDVREQHLLEMLAGHGMEVRRCWIQSALADAPQHAFELAQLLMYAPRRKRPDGLIIADDNLLLHATQGLVAAGVRVPDELEVVAHTNFPWPTPSAVPARRLGFDTHRLLQACIETIEKQRRGQRVPAMNVLPPVFEEELAGNSDGASVSDVRPSIFSAQEVV
jgi:DNA-binding LacI/PurR family transcriptional regulator